MSEKHKRLVMTNHTHTWCHNITPFRSASGEDNLSGAGEGMEAEAQLDSPKTTAASVCSLILIVTQGRVEPWKEE